MWHSRGSRPPGSASPRDEMTLLLQDLSTPDPRFRDQPAPEDLRNYTQWANGGGVELISLAQLIDRYNREEIVDHLDVISILWTLEVHVDDPVEKTRKRKRTRVNVNVFRNRLKSILVTEDMRKRLRVCCCDSRLYSSSQVICVNCDCVVPVNYPYHEYVVTSPERRVLLVCNRCFSRNFQRSRREPFQNQDLQSAPSNGFGRQQNNAMDKRESTVQCAECGFKSHARCVNFVERPESDEVFICDFCHVEFRIPMTNDYIGSLKVIPKTGLSKFIEAAVNALDCGMRRIHVRVVGYVPKCFTLENSSRTFLRPLAVKTSRPYMSRAILCFQESECGGTTAFFSIHATEFNKEGAIYISMIDSAQLVISSCRRTYILHCILLRYLSFMRGYGYKAVYLWVCPPLRKEIEYVFNRRPPTQKLINFQRLKQWYMNFMEVGIRMGVFSEFSTLHDWFQNLDLIPEQFFQVLPLFPEDHWPGFLNKEIERLDGNSGDKTVLVYSSLMKELKRLKDRFFRMALAESEVTHALGSDPLIPSRFHSRDPLVEFQRQRELQFCDHRQGRFSTKSIAMELLFETPTLACDTCLRPIHLGGYCTSCTSKQCADCLLPFIDHRTRPIVAMSSMAKLGQVAYKKFLNDVRTANANPFVPGVACRRCKDDVVLITE